jgi:hypothetical protein
LIRLYAYHSRLSYHSFTYEGKHSSRAIHLQVLAPGTVELESIVAKNVFATIIATPKYSPTNSNNEMPGKLKLFEPVKYDQNEEIVVLDTVELWARCVPENIVFQVLFRLNYSVVRALLFLRLWLLIIEAFFPADIILILSLHPTRSIVALDGHFRDYRLNIVVPLL